MSIDRGLLATLEAKPGKEEELRAFLEKGRELAAADAEIRTIDVIAVK
ncbi:hypothetical protein [Kribbella sp. VKM Ac-2568]|nr:hypothetical protein [Kribbella sp. VKM Ac-2568]TCM45311.1 hypothetical protein EV648_107465 [Kribbella sp. VKM Ac-2568]